MPSLQNLTFVAIFLTLLISIVSANPLVVKEKERSQVGDVDQLLQLLDQIDPPALHAALHDFSPKKFKHGVFQEDRTALKALHRVDAAAATNIISLAKRLGSADNGTSVGQQTPSSTINAASTTTVVAAVSSPVSVVTKSVASNVAPAPVGPATATSTSQPAGVIGSTTTVIASTPPTTVLVTSTLPASSAGASSSPPAGSQSSSAAAGAGGAGTPSGTPSQASSAASQGSTQGSSGGSSMAAGSVVTSTNAAGVTLVSIVGGGVATFGSVITTTNAAGATLVSTVGGGVATFGSVVTSTDARGLTIVSTIGGGVVTIEPSGSQGASPSTAAGSQSTTAPGSESTSAAAQSSHTSVFLQTTTLPGGAQSTITAVTVVPGPAAPTPSGTAGAKSGTSTTAAPGLQSGGAVASRMVGWELAGLLGGAVGVAMVL